MTVLFYFLIVFACIFLASMCIIILVATIFGVFRLFGYFFDDVIDFVIVWKHRKEITNLPDNQSQEVL